MMEDTAGSKTTENPTKKKVQNSVKLLHVKGYDYGVGLMIPGHCDDDVVCIGFIWFAFSLFR